MRVLFALALIALAVAGLTPARAADLVEPNSDGGWPDGGSYGGWSHGVRVMPVVIYDYEPGVTVRHYWLSPWRHRHYFPVTGKTPVFGRDEDLSITGEMPPPAETFYRSWSTTALLAHDKPRKHVRMRALDDEGVPRRAPTKP